ncbi:MAG TPA: phosphotransferase family protein [Hyphomonas sp.]|nr:phosphotransferase family protein [Hyphomonas sp.]HRJ02290.1 phosphotransferase family protein [Hyphomonas sp.]HRK67545.1 phosphotransferase family protein [Hyphomonas sp.]
METPVDLAILASWMDARGLGAGPLEDVQRLAGGTQNILLKFSRAGRFYVLRRPPPVLRANSNETMRREARVLAALKGTPVPHPGLIAACEDESVLGAAFYLMDPIDGYNATTGLPEPFASSPQLRHQMGLSLVDGIAALGAQDYVALGLTGLGKPDNYLERQVSRWKAQLDSYAEFPEWDGLKDLPDVDGVGRWLEEHRPRSFQPGIIHGDYHLANVMYRFDAPRLAAIVDWELTTIGDPLLDLGWLLATWPEEGSGTVSVTPWEGFPSADELVAHYAKQTTRDLSRIHWYGVLACYKLGIILEGTYARACAGKAPKATGDQLHASTIGLLQRANRWIS